MLESGDAASIGVGLSPAGVLADLYTAGTGEDYFTGEEIPGWMRAAVLVPGVSELRKSGRVADAARGVGGGIPLPGMKSSPFGPKIDGVIPASGVPTNWSRTQIADAIVDYRTSLASRRAELAAFDSIGGGSFTRRLAHARRISQEEDFLRSLEKDYGSRR